MRCRRSTAGATSRFSRRCRGRARRGSRFRPGFGPGTESVASRLIWEAVGDEELIGYNVYRSPRPDLEFERLESVSGASYTTARTSYVDSHLTAGVRYYYKVSSVSSGFESELSGYVSGESRADVLAPEPPGRFGGDGVGGGGGDSLELARAAV